MGRVRVLSILTSGVLICTSSSASAQSLGTFRWQLQPFCNVVTLAITQNESSFRLEGTDNQCGTGGGPASAIGTAFLNPDGSVALGLTLVASPGAAPTHVMAQVNIATLGGTWQDSGGNTGAFVFTTGAASGGSPRAAAASAIGAVAVNPSQVQLRVSGVCPAGQLMQAVNQNGTVTCAGVAGGDITAVAAGFGLLGGGTSGDVSIGLRTTPSGAFDLSNTSGFAAALPEDTGGSLAVSGPGRRFVWYAGKGALRAGQVDGTQWDEGNIGRYSVALGHDVVATGETSLAVGNRASARGSASFAMGHDVIAAGSASVALGSFASATTTGTFMFGDASTNVPLITVERDQFLVRASGGTAFYSSPTLVTGVELLRGAGAWANASDVNLKEQFRDLDGDEVLSKIAGMPIREWKYKEQDASIRHVGPTAQDFRAAFGLGENPLKISTVDADGIALRAIQALEARTRTQHANMLEDTQALADENDSLVQENAERIAEIATLKAEIVALRARLDALEAKPR